MGKSYTLGGCPLKTDPSISHRPFVDWVKVEEMLIEKGLI
jgi:hypothetical protein